MNQKAEQIYLIIILQDRGEKTKPDATMNMG